MTEPLTAAAGRNRADSDPLTAPRVATFSVVGTATDRGFYIVAQC